MVQYWHSSVFLTQIPGKSQFAKVHAISLTETASLSSKLDSFIIDLEATCRTERLQQSISLLPDQPGVKPWDLLPFQNDGTPRVSEVKLWRSSELWEKVSPADTTKVGHLMADCSVWWDQIAQNISVFFLLVIENLVHRILANTFL